MDEMLELKPICPEKNSTGQESGGTTVNELNLVLTVNCRRLFADPKTCYDFLSFCHARKI